MDRSYRFDLSMFERFERETREHRGFEPHMMLKNKNGTPFLGCNLPVLQGFTGFHQDS